MNDSMMEEFSTLNIVEALKIPRERLRDWMTRGFVKPTTPADGQGKAAIFSKLDVYAIALFKSLLEYGINRKAAGKIVSDFREMVDHKDAKWLVLRKFGSGKMEARQTIVALSEKSGWINFVTGTISDPVTSSATPDSFGDLSRPVEDWRMIHIVNYTALRDEVDAAMDRLHKPRSFPR